MSNTRHRISRVVLVSLALYATPSADVLSPILGRWKLNATKSDFGGLTMAFAPAPASALRQSVNGGAFHTIALDGRDVPTHSGYTSAWRQLDDHTWSATTKLNGRVISVDELQLSADNHTLRLTQSDGKSSTNTLIYTRTSGTTGLRGTWKAGAVSSGEQVIEFARRGGDGLTLRTSSSSSDARIDGKDYPLTGPQMPAGATLSFTQTGQRSIVLAQKQNGRLISKSTFSVSSDGKVLTETVVNTDTGKTRATKVYERQ